MPHNMNITYAFVQPSSATPVVSASVTRGNIPVAPEPVYIDLAVDGFTLPNAKHATMEPKVSGLFYKTVWRNAVGQFVSPKNLTHNDKSTIHGSRFMWMFDEPGSYTADVTVINMYDHTEIATTTIGPIVVEDYLSWFTANGENRVFHVVSRDGDRTGVPTQIVDHKANHNSAVWYPNTLAKAVTNLRYRLNKPTCILVKQGEVHPEQVNAWEAETPNLYIRTYTGNLGTAAPVLTAGNGITVGGSFPNTPGISVQISGLDYDGGLNISDQNLGTASSKKFIGWGSTTQAIVGIHDCRASKGSVAFQGSSDGAAQGVIMDCDFSGNTLNNLLIGFGQFTQLLGSRFMYDDAAPGTYQNSSGGWSVRMKDDCSIWMCEIGAKQGHDATDAIQPSLRLGKSTGQGGGYAYVGASTLFSNISFGTAGSFDNTTTINAVIEGNRIANQSQRLTGSIYTIMSGVSAWNNITAYPSANPHVGAQFNGSAPFEWGTLSGLVPDAGVLDVGLEAQFNTHLSLSDATTTANDNFVAENAQTGSQAMTNIVDQNNLVVAPYEASPNNASALNMSQYGDLSHVVSPYFAFDVSTQHGTGVADAMITVSGTNLGFVAGQSIAQGGVSADIFVVQDDGIETRLWVANQVGGSFASGPVTSVTGSGSSSGPAQYRGTMINAAPTAPMAASAKTWVPPLDHYWSPRNFDTAVIGAVEA